MKKLIFGLLAVIGLVFIIIRVLGKVRQNDFYKNLISKITSSFTEVDKEAVGV